VTPLTEDQIWPGVEARTCGEHRPLGVGYSWCYHCAERCSATIPCDRCELPGLRAERDQLRATVEVIAEWRKSMIPWATKSAQSSDFSRRAYGRIQLEIAEDIRGILAMAPPQSPAMIAARESLGLADDQG